MPKTSNTNLIEKKKKGEKQQKKHFTLLETDFKTNIKLYTAMYICISVQTLLGSNWR